VVDAQFNAAYIFSVVACGVRIGPEWQDTATMRDPVIRDLMTKVTFGGHPEFVERAQENPREHLCTVDVVARGKTFHVETLTPRGTVGTSGAMSEADLESKFRHNAERILTQHQIDKATDLLLNLEKLNDTSFLMKTICI